MEVTVDVQGRVSLAGIRTREYTRYSAEELPDGTVILRPLVSISPIELEALKAPGVQSAAARATAGGNIAFGSIQV